MWRVLITYVSNNYSHSIEKWEDSGEGVGIVLEEIFLRGFDVGEDTIKPEDILDVTVLLSRSKV